MADTFIGSEDALIRFTIPTPSPLPEGEVHRLSMHGCSYYEDRRLTPSCRSCAAPAAWQVHERLSPAYVLCEACTLDMMLPMFIAGTAWVTL